MDELQADDADLQVLPGECLEGRHGSPGGGLELEGGPLLTGGGAAMDGAIPFEGDGDGDPAVLLETVHGLEPNAAAGAGGDGQGDADVEAGGVVAESGDAIAYREFHGS